MNRCRYGQSSETTNPAQKNLTLWSNLAFVLDIGDPTSDPASNPVVAVTGYLDGTGIKSFVVARNDQVLDNAEGGRFYHETISSPRTVDTLFNREIALQ